MAFVPVPKDLAQVKTKVLFNLTKRQLICFGGGILIGLPLFFILKTMLPSSAAAILMILVMLPCFMFGMYERNGQPLEKILHYFIQSRFTRPKKRPYKTKEDELKRELERYERYHPGYDEYVIEADTSKIWHDPYALIAIISAYHGGEEWTIDDV